MTTAHASRPAAATHAAPMALFPVAVARAAAAARPDRPTTAILYDAPDARLVVFRLAAGQEVPPHRNGSTVLLQVLEGAGVLSGEDGERRCVAGEIVAFAPNELHGMRATEGELLLLATIAPRPGARG